MALQAMPRTVTARRRQSFSLTPYLYLLPGVLGITLLFVYPIIDTIRISLTNYNLYHSTPQSPPQWVGLKNYTDLLSPDSPFAQLFFSVFLWTVIFALVTSVLNYFAGLLVALVLNNPRLRERVIYRTILIVPWALPSTITILIWQGLLNKDFGAIDSLLTSIGLPAVPWLLDAHGTQAAIFIVNLWLSFPFQMVVVLGGLQAIPGDVYEAAAVDGASAIQRMLRITLPLVFRVTMPAMLLSFSFSLTNFGIIYLLNNGGPPRTDTSFAGSTDTLITFIYNLTLTFSRYDRAGALAVIVFFITAGLSLIGFRLTGAFKEVQA